MVADAIGARFLRCARGSGWRGVCRTMGANARAGHVRFCFAKCQVLIFGLSHDAGSEEYRSQNGQAPNRSIVQEKSLWPMQNDFLRLCSQEIRIVLLSGSWRAAGWRQRSVLLTRTPQFLEESMLWCVREPRTLAYGAIALPSSASVLTRGMWA